MSSASFGHQEGRAGVTVDDASLAVAIAHELSSPLVLLRQLGLSVAEGGSLDESERRLLGERLTLTSERALRMAAGLSMASAHQQAFELEPINPISVCQDVTRQLTPLFMAHGQRLALKSRTRIPLLVGNRELLKQILLSFGDNALYYGSQSDPVRMNIVCRGDRVRIGVRDYGPAVPTNIWQQVEERIARRASSPLATRPHASVVGLIAARRLAELMGGVIGITRHRDGTTFFVDLRVSGQMSLL